MRTGNLTPSASGYVNIGTDNYAYASGVFDNLIVSGVAVGGGGGVPSGGIIMWSGSISAAAALAPDWYLCNGSNGTPDLRDKFIVCAKQDDSGVAKTNLTGSLTQSGGSADHTHSGTTAATGGLYNAYTGLGSYYANGGHTHTFTSENQSTTPVPYYALALIMKS